MDKNAWRSLLSQAQRNNISEMIIQWSQFDDERFDGSYGWLASVLDLAIEKNVGVWFGLYFSPTLTKQLARHDANRERHLSDYFSTVMKTYSEWETWLIRRRSHIFGLYIPLELNDTDFSDVDERTQIINILSRERKKYSLPVMISIYWTKNISLQDFVRWVHDIENIGFIVLVQDDRGVRRNARFDQDRMSQQLACSTPLIAEVFQQNQGYPHFSAERLTIQTFTEMLSQNRCHHRYLFSLRYIPWQMNPLLLSDPE